MWFFECLAFFRIYVLCWICIRLTHSHICHKNPYCAKWLMGAFPKCLLAFSSKWRYFLKSILNVQRFIKPYAIKLFRKGWSLFYQTEMRSTPVWVLYKQPLEVEITNGWVAMIQSNECSASLLELSSCHSDRLLKTGLVASPHLCRASTSGLRPPSFPNAPQQLSMTYDFTHSQAHSACTQYFVTVALSLLLDT